MVFLKKSFNSVFTKYLLSTKLKLTLWIHIILLSLPALLKPFWNWIWVYQIPDWRVKIMRRFIFLFSSYQSHFCILSSNSARNDFVNFESWLLPEKPEDFFLEDEQFAEEVQQKEREIYFTPEAVVWGLTADQGMKIG